MSGIKTYNCIHTKKVSNLVLSKLEKVLKSNSFKKTTSNPEYVFILGGDGTFVKSIRSLYSKNVHIIPINTGTLGFYSMFNKKRIPTINDILDESKYITPDILNIKIGNKTFNAINEVAIQSINTISCDININDTFYETFKGSGVLVCTKTGSTGYAKSAGGSLISPDVNAYQLVELFPTLNVKKNSIGSPIILDTNSHIDVKKLSFDSECFILIDGNLVQKIQPNTDIHIRVSKPKFKLHFINNTNQYINKLQKTFIKG